ncbi:MAG: hypothetical protein KDA28_12575 [Phycisphaerales bacterium]|nr:hypothetical protein [Phycisphaerales bacterium]
MSRVSSILLTPVVATLLLWTVARPGQAPSSFEWVDVIIETSTPLAAWQVRVTSPGVRIVGVEAGEAPFDEAPAYDPVALRDREEIIIASFDTGTGLVSGRVRVARLHVRVSGAPSWSGELMVAADDEGCPIDASLLLERGTP